MKKGKFIVIDGTDGAGKTSVIDLLKEELGDNYVFTREPGGTEIGKQIRQYILNANNDTTELDLIAFLVDRKIHINQIINPNLEEGKHVITDRFDDSTFAYQILGGGADISFYQKLKKELDIDIDASHYFYLICRPDIAKERMNSRDDNNKYDEKELEFKEKVYGHFINQGLSKPSATLINTSDLTLDEVYDKVRETILEITSPTL